MLQKSRGIVLHAVKFRDNSLIATCYSKEFGRTTIQVNHAYGSGKTAGLAVYFQPLDILDLVFYKKETSEISLLKEVAIAIPLSELHFDPVKISISMFVSEVIYRTVREVEPNSELYEFLENSIRLLDVMHDGVANFHLIFLIQLTRYLGFYPANGWSETMPFFDYKNGFFCPSPPSHSFNLDKTSSRRLGMLLGTPFYRSNEISLNHAQRIQAINDLLCYYNFHLGSPLDFKTLPILIQLFQ
ncbi:MAG: DNA repair protein RecO [Bacteroidales bacterium]|jgi:DNA repair protein RecO (recombination protein O)|nr:DNA repair protein RecO [Bacteroidales bacterium]HOC36435.1 DNA repair protein RecO [Tenuifilaceae bacterium]MBP8643369.1 DNA repair protein RecO [Bacteroidales bacterium]HOG72141.1 DNA repair protein RecO [Tenuifilaceae bacterium]HPA67724.1 DNA repair protein RecO [Tenuifilaceae bacterium]